MPFVSGGHPAAVMLFAVLVLAACQTAPSAQLSGAPSPGLDGGASTDASRPPSAAASATASALPTVPAGFPVAPGATQLGEGEHATGLIAAWETDEVGPVVYDFYLAALPTAGFEVIGAYPGGAAATIRFRAGAAVLDVSLTGGLEGTVIELRVPEP